MLIFQIFIFIVFAFFAASLASFLNVVIYRTVKGESFAKGRSYCESCKKELAYYDNIPIFSFLRLAGKCRYCKKKIKAVYFWTEVLAAVYALFFLFILESQGLFSTLEIWQIIFYFLFFLVLIFVVVSDLRYMIIPDTLNLLLMIFVLFYQIKSGSSWGSSLLALAFSMIFFSSLFFLTKKIYKKDAFGIGDIKLMIPLSFFLAWPKAVLAIFLAFIIGGFFAMLVLATGKKKFGQNIAFGPFLVLATVLTIFWGDLIWTWYFGLLI